MLWLALHLPHLPLEALASPPEARSQPTAVVSRERIVVCDAATTAAGITPGMHLASAWARLPQLATCERDEACEATALRRLACWAGSFTSEVCLLPPQTLLLEVSGSLTLFGGAEALFTRVIADCAEQGFQPQAALAPTPLAAEWLAIGASGRLCLDPSQLRQNLEGLPLTVVDAVLNLPAADAARLVAFGSQKLGDVLRLPRAGLARRLGANFATRLAQALGEYPDHRPRFAFPESFAESLELPAPVTHSPALIFAARRLLAALCGWLAARQAGINECFFELEHERGIRARPATLLKLGFAAATRDLERIARVLGERLHGLSLPAAVESLRLRAETPQPLSARTASLFAVGEQGGSAEANSNQLAALIEHLQARLGDKGVHSLALGAEHRPELASLLIRPNLAQNRKALPGKRSDKPQPNSHHPPRPLCLLPQPQALRELAGRPQHNGPLQLLAGPERIESGWWDADESGALGDLRRDYFIALSPGAEWLWIFRDAGGWFLHGLFA